ncbi:helix-turn-helix transcriptional regulator [Candidatus Viridilinea mediisalina]|uniref:Transcriptional regulator n=1 Tax=Candidatus Viridilinea mediisalina TaxID=2024553 RepID=A0A2A6RIJ6_9CHLR|nr:helix-turn-helix domain-containing protein [Candidatus Viridilinea mediisalina]PDW02842.1 transcriptional regulator [Candidatus Viridilinea mediisalina]
MATERKEQGSTRRSILQLLRRHGEMTALELSECLYVGAVGIRQHLGLLERDGLVQIVGLRRGVGRPANLYALTPRAEESFPRRYDRLALDLIHHVERHGGETAVTEMLAGRRQRQLRDLAPHLADQTCRERVATLTNLLAEQGYMCEWEEEEDGSLILTEYNCPVDCVARQCLQLCDQEVKLYRELLAAPVIQEITLAQGGGCCRYRITPVD